MKKQTRGSTVRERHAQVEGHQTATFENSGAHEFPDSCHSDDVFSNARSNKSSILVESCMSVVTSISYFTLDCDHMF